MPGDRQADDTDAGRSACSTIQACRILSGSEALGDLLGFVQMSSIRDLFAAKLALSCFASSGAFMKPKDPPTVRQGRMEPGKVLVTKPIKHYVPGPSNVAPFWALN